MGVLAENNFYENLLPNIFLKTKKHKYLARDFLNRIKNNDDDINRNKLLAFR